MVWKPQMFVPCCVPIHQVDIEIFCMTSKNFLADLLVVLSEKPGQQQSIYDSALQHHGYAYQIQKCLPHGVVTGKVLGHQTVSRIQPLVTMNVCTKLYSSPSTNGWDISDWPKLPWLKTMATSIISFSTPLVSLCASFSLLFHHFKDRIRKTLE